MFFSTTPARQMQRTYQKEDGEGPEFHGKGWRRSWSRRLNTLQHNGQLLLDWDMDR